MAHSGSLWNPASTIDCTTESTDKFAKQGSLSDSHDCLVRTIVVSEQVWRASTCSSARWSEVDQMGGVPLCTGRMSCSRQKAHLKNCTKDLKNAAFWAWGSLLDCFHKPLQRQLCVPGRPYMIKECAGVVQIFLEGNIGILLALKECRTCHSHWPAKELLMRWLLCAMLLPLLSGCFVPITFKMCLVWSQVLCLQARQDLLALWIWLAWGRRSEYMHHRLCGGCLWDQQHWSAVAELGHRPLLYSLLLCTLLHGPVD